MNIIIILIAISMTIALLFLAIFFWCMKSGQYDDTYTPAVRMLFENKGPKEKNAETGDGKDVKKESENNSSAPVETEHDEASPHLKRFDERSVPSGRMLFANGSVQQKNP